MSEEKLSRFEVIDTTGRVLTFRGDIKLSFQDGKQTLKIFLGEKIALPQWQPIETAPKTGEDILLFCVSYYGDGTQKVIHEATISVGSWQKYNDDEEMWSPDFDAGWDCTHWMPLPPEPKIG